MGFLKPVYFNSRSRYLISIFCYRGVDNQHLYMLLDEILEMQIVTTECDLQRVILQVVVVVADIVIYRRTGSLQSSSYNSCSFN